MGLKVFVQKYSNVTIVRAFCYFLLLLSQKLRTAGFVKKIFILLLNEV